MVLHRGGDINKKTLHLFYLKLNSVLIIQWFYISAKLGVRMVGSGDGRRATSCGEPPRFNCSVGGALCRASSLFTKRLRDASLLEVVKVTGNGRRAAGLEPRA